MKKVGIVTFYDAKNYGAFLQCFATFKVLSKKYDASIIDYSNKSIKKSYCVIKHNSVKNFIKSIVFLKKNILKNKNFNKAIKDNLLLTNKNLRYDIVVAGSDQIWNIELTGGYDNIFSLEYFNNCKKISYASSVGKESLIDNNKEIYERILDNIDYISVRENSCRDFLIKLTNRDIKVNLDPTLLLDASIWDKYTTRNNVDKKYIFSYFVAVTKENYDTLNKLSKKMRLPVLSYSLNPKEDNILKDCYTDGPFEFISNIKNAEFVFTSSFHGVVFSIIFNKKFICMLPREKANRIINLLEKLDLLDRVIRNEDDLDAFDFSKDIDYISVNKKLEELRNDSLNWLYRSIDE